jgi:EAL domain-containing protein (putative c-di-GMP-specific phosphodiesterase class I)
MTELPSNRRNRLRFGPLLRVLLPSLLTLVLVVMLVFAMFYTEFDWQWIAFLAGILFASVLALVSASLKSGWRTARRAAEAVHFKQRLSAEIQQHRGTREQLERELALHQQDRMRLAREIDAHQLAVKEKLAAETMLERHLQETAAAAPVDTDRSAAGEAQLGATKLVIADQSGNAVYLSSLTEELTGWGNPRERIRQAIQNDGFDLYAQDIVALRADVRSGNMHELLIRMRDEEQNLVPPGTFLPIAERFGLMPDIDRFVVRKAIAARATAGSSANAASVPVLCINLARASIEDRSFPEFVARALEQSGVSGKSLCFEFADSDAIACVPEAARFAYELKPLGCLFTLDGFGRQGIGFDHVKTLPLDFLKIDGSIILQILRVREALAKVRAIQRVCKVIGIRTIAEMVESDDVREQLRAVEIDFAQGFGIAQPRPFT